MLDKQKAIAALEAYRSKCKGVMASTVAECSRIIRKMPEDDGWISVRDRLPENGLVVRTKIHDENGSRNEGKLKRRGNLWFLPDGTMYVYYTPTHWMPLPEPPKEERT